MKYFKKMVKSFAFALGSILILTFLVTVLNFFDLIDGKVMMVLKVIIPLFSLALGGFIIGKNSKSRGWLEGLKLGLIFIILLALSNLIVVHEVTYKDFIYYAILLFSAIFGSMFGINMKRSS